MAKVVLSLVVMVVCICSGEARAALKVVTTTQNLAAIARTVGGDQVNVFSLTLGTRDPHYAEAKPSMIRRVHRADLLLMTGADLEIAWLPALLQAARNSKIQPGSPGLLDLSLVVPLKGVPDSPVTRAMGDVHPQGNPHYSLDPENGVLVARAIAERLSQMDEPHTAEYDARAEAFAAEIYAKLPLWRQATMPLKGKPVIAYHTSFIYLADALGFVIADELEPKPGIAPSASHLNQLIARIEREHIGLLILEPYYERRSSEFLKERTGIRVAVIPQSVGALPGIKTYAGLFDAIVAALMANGGN